MTLKSFSHRYWEPLYPPSRPGLYARHYRRVSRDILRCRAGASASSENTNANPKRPHRVGMNLVVAAPHAQGLRAGIDNTPRGLKLPVLAPVLASAADREPPQAGHPSQSGPERG